MRVTFDFTDTTFHLHAEGVANSDQSQKIERPWASAKVALYDADGECEQVIVVEKDGTFNVAGAGGDSVPDPMSMASKVVEDPEPEEPRHSSSYSDMAMPSDTPDPLHASVGEEGLGFAAMSRHADEADERSHES